MNLREETIKVLRDVLTAGNHAASQLIARIGPTFPDDYPPSMDPEDALNKIGDTTIYDLWVLWSTAMNTRSLLSRLEAGSGEETGWQPTHKHPKGGMYRLLFTAWTPDVPCELAIFEDASGRKYARQLSSFNEVYEALNQEGGDAAVTDRRSKASELGERSEGSHVATPAPGENSGRADVAHWMIANGFATGHGDTTADLLSELSWQITERVDKARRYGLEEAAKEIERSAKVLRPDELALVVRNLVPSVQS